MRFVSGVKNWSDSSVTATSSKHSHLDHFRSPSWFSYLQGAPRLITSESLWVYTGMFQLSLDTQAALSIDCCSARHRFQLLTPRETFESIESCGVFYANSHNGSTLSWSGLCSLLAASPPVIFVCVSPVNTARYLAPGGGGWYCAQVRLRKLIGDVLTKNSMSQKQPLSLFLNLQQTQLEADT